MDCIYAIALNNRTGVRMNISRKIVQATVVIFLLTFLSRFLGLGREMAIAYRFGATGETDAFMLALTIPNIFYNVIGTALAAVIVPVFEDYEIQGRRSDIWRALSTTINVIIVVMGAGVIFGATGSSYIVRALGPGFPAETMQLAINLTALMMPSVIFITLAGVFGGILNANQIFGPVALGPVAMNLAIIVSALAGFYQWGVYNLALGTVIGALLFALIQVPALRQVGFEYAFVLNIQDPAVRQMLKMIGPILIVTGIFQIYTVIDVRFASSLGAGSIAALNYARKIMQLPQAIFVTAVTTAIFPTLTKLAAESRVPEMAGILQKAMKVILLLAIPGSVGLIILRDPFIALLFERGAFDSQATVRTAEALLYYTLGLFGLCLHLPLTRTFFALKDTKTPFWIMLGTVGLKILLSSALVNLFLHSGLALATSLTIMSNVALLSYFLYRRIPRIFNLSFFYFVGKIILAALLMGSIIYGADRLLAIYLGTRGWMIIRIVLDITLGVVTFAGLGLALRLDELRYVFSMYRRFYC
jgi:putative peptidoglycan lipid II flippase